MKIIYLVDCENQGFPNLHHNDNRNVKTIYFTGIRDVNMTHFNERTELFRIEHSGKKEAMDKIITTYLGYLIATENTRDTAFIIVSSDKGFLDVINFWQSRGIACYSYYDLDVSFIENLLINIFEIDLFEKTEKVQGSNIRYINTVTSYNTMKNIETPIEKEGYFSQEQFCEFITSKSYTDNIEAVCLIDATELANFIYEMIKPNIENLVSSSIVTAEVPKFEKELRGILKDLSVKKLENVRNIYRSIVRSNTPSKKNLEKQLCQCLSSKYPSRDIEKALNFLWEMVLRKEEV